MGRTGDQDSFARMISPEEIATLEQQGWVMLKQLVSRDMAKRMRAAGEDLMKAALPVLEQAEGSEVPNSGGTISKKAALNEGEANLATRPSGVSDFSMTNVRAEPFTTVQLDKTLGEMVSRVFNRGRVTDREVSVQLIFDVLICKNSIGAESGNGTFYHQDGAYFDRNGMINVWISLDDLTPEHGTMRFLTGSHREGSLGQHPPDASTGGPLDEYPKLTEYYDWSPPLYYGLGDTTAHHQFMVHGAPENISGQQRWSYILNYVLSDTVQTVKESRERVHVFP